MSVQTEKPVNINYNELVTELKNTLNFHLKDLFTSFFNNADTALFELANEASNNEEQKQYFDLLHSIRSDKANLSRGLSDALRSYLKPITALSPVSASELEDDDDDDELSLVSQETMDELVLINTIAGKSYDHFSEAINHLSIRLEFLAEQTPMIFSKDALIPLHFCESFQKTITILDITTADKLILYKLFDNEVAGNLNILYDRLNNLLIEAGVLPKIKRKAPQNQSSANAGDYDDSYDEDNADDTSDIGNTATGGAGGRRSTGNGAGNTGNSGATAGAGEPTAGSGMSSAGSSNNNSIPVSESEKYNQALIQKYGQKDIGGYPIERASNIIRDFIGSNSATAGSVEGDPQFYGHKDVLSALTKMQQVTQSNIQHTHPVVERIDAASIKQALLTTIASQQGGTITKQINQVIEKTIDFIKLIFDAIIDDESISDTIKALLLTLQIPVIKASMMDQEFFVNDDHPARELLDKIAELSVGVTDHSDPLYIELYDIIKYLLKNYATEIDAFVIALDKVEAIISLRESKAEEKELEAQEQVQKEHARKIVLWELRKCTLEKKLPSLIHKLVLKLWPTLMYNHYIKYGKQNDEWISLVTALGELIDSVQTPTNAIDYKFLKDNHEGIIERVEKRLAKSKRAKDHLEEAVHNLREIYAHLLDTEEFDEALSSPELSTMPVMDTLDGESDKEHSHTDEQLQEPSPAAEEEPVDLRAKLQLLPGDVRPGVWFQVTMDNKKIRRLKLSVIIMEEALLVFVDHNGERVVEKDAETFAEELKNGEAQIIMHHSVFDHALGSVFETIK
ncbi:MAG: DUF1631 domain-containing protein [Gammaproteobacteria bacterium]|nr:DUF1631 domain-containing protein [Gammaproteobacteria bacterium]